jgi:hypothetical protein
MTSHELVEQVLACVSCGSTSLDLNSVRIEANEFSGHVLCTKCNHRSPFVNGVLDCEEATDGFGDAVDQRNKAVFYNTWELAPAEYNAVPYDTEFEIYENLKENFRGVMLDAGCGSGRAFEFTRRLT